MDSLRLDLRYAIRNLLRRPGFSALAILTLAVGIGVNTVAFSAVNALLFHPFVFKGVDQLGWVMLSAPGNAYGQLSWAEFNELRRSTQAFDAVAAEGRQPLALMVDGRAQQLWTLLVSVDYFRALGSRAETGRLLDAGDAGRADLAAVVSHRFWQERMGGGSLAGRTLTFADRVVSVVGVLPDMFRGPGGLYAPDVWLPLDRIDALQLPARLHSGDERWLTAIARLGAGTTMAQASTELSVLTAQLSAESASRPSPQRVLRFVPMRDGHPELRGLAPMVWIAMATVGVVLLIACFNVAALLLARATERQREIGIRTALGAGRGRIVRQLMTEGVVLAVLSGGAALAVAAWSGSLLEVFSLPSPIPLRLQLPVDGRLVGFTVLLVLVAGVLPGLLPALQATRRDVVRSIRVDSGFGDARPARVRNIFVITQVAGSTLFLALAILFVRSFWNATSSDPGFDTQHTVVAQMEPSRYGFEGRADLFANTLVERLSIAPGIVATAADRVPFYVGLAKSDLVSTDVVDCVATSCRPVSRYSIGRRHFETMGIPFRAGRDFTDAEAKAGGAVIISEAMANALYAGRSPLGQVVRLGRDRTLAEVVGVVADIKHRGVEEPLQPVFYKPLRESDLGEGFTLVARTSGDRGSLMAAVRDAVHALAPAMPVTSITTMTERMQLPLWPRRTAAFFFLICGTLALLLATVGLFGVTYYAVRQRTREFGIRIALGARSSDVVRQVLREGMWLAMAGATIGLIAAAIGGRLLARGLFGVSPGDAVSFGSATAIEALVALMACALPARQATQADPMAALRDE